jgi:hypothetical protein
MAPKAAVFLALSLLLAAAAHGCEPHCSTSPPPSNSHGSCPIDALKLSVCANLLGGLVHVALPEHQCCPLLEGLVDLDAALCLCTAIKANVLGINLDVPLSLGLILNNCGRTCPKDFTCPI